eukprot:2689458-Rhodomonas_salina.1
MTAAAPSRGRAEVGGCLRNRDTPRPHWQRAAKIVGARGTAIPSRTWSHPAVGRAQTLGSGVRVDDPEDAGRGAAEPVGWLWSSGLLESRVPVQACNGPGDSHVVSFSLRLGKLQSESPGTPSWNVSCPMTSTLSRQSGLLAGTVTQLEALRLWPNGHSCHCNLHGHDDPRSCEST